MHSRLLIAHQNIRKSRLLQRLPDARHIPMPKNSKHSCKKRLLPSIALRILILQKSNNRLRRGQTS